MPGLPFVEVEEGVRNGVSYVVCTENVIGLISSTISQVQLFVPAKRLTVTAYLLDQTNTNFKTIQEFRNLRDNFLDDYISFIEKHF